MSNQNDTLQTLTKVIEKVEPDFVRVRVDESTDFRREASFAVQILRGNEFTLRTAYNNPESLRNAVTNVAAIGISLNPASKQAYLVPRKGAICLDISYMGMMHLAQVSGAIVWGQAVIVRASDHFELTEIDKAPVHKYSPFASKEQRGEIVGAYVVVKTTEGDYLTHCMQIDDINTIKNRSESVKSGKSSPWLTDFEEMAKKTVVKQAHKYWPRRERLDNAIHYMDTDGGEGVEKDVTPTYEHDKALEWARKARQPSHVDLVITKSTAAGASEDELAELRTVGDASVKAHQEAQHAAA